MNDTTSDYGITFAEAEAKTPYNQPIGYIPSGPVKNWACCSKCGADLDRCNCPDY